MEEKIGWYTHPAFEKWAAPFEEKYQMTDVLMVGDTLFARNKTHKQEGRHCNFCNRDYPETTFRNAAHLLSRMIGNTDLYSTFECDACNQKFSLFETDLASFLGLGRSITGLKEERLPPGFPGVGLEAKSILFKGKKLLVIHKENAERNIEEGSTKLQYQKPSYTPANIYKLFLKCALSVLPQDEVVSDFQLALEYLQGDKVLTGAHINIFRFSLTIDMPLHVYIFKKKTVTDKLPLYVASFYFDNLVMTIPVLLHRDDLVNLSRPIEMPAAPPYFVYGNEIDKIEPSFLTRDLSSPFKLKFEPEEIIMQYNKSDLEQSIRFDSKTGEETQTAYNPAGSKYFIGTEEGVTFTKEEMTEMIKVIDDKFSSENDPHR